MQHFFFLKKTYPPPPSPIINWSLHNIYSIAATLPKRGKSSMFHIIVNMPLGKLEMSEDQASGTDILLNVSVILWTFLVPIHYLECNATSM